MITYGKLVEKINKLKALGFSDDRPIEYSYILDKILQDDTVTLDDLLGLSEYIQNRLYARIRSDENTLDICMERLSYVSKYLSGRMYSDQKPPSERDLIQLNNVLEAMDSIKAAGE